MAKSSKPRNSEFLAERRKAIAELAKRRRQKRILTAAASAVNRTAKVAGRVSLPSAPAQN